MIGLYRSLSRAQLFFNRLTRVIRKQQSTNAIETSALNDLTLPLSGNAEDPDASPASTGDVTGELIIGNAESNAIDTRSVAPLRILVTRRTERDRIISVQYLLSSMGYLAPQKFSGRLGNATVTAIKAFQKANGMPETGAFTADLAKKVYEVAGREEPPDGHLFVRQDLKPVFDAPVAFHNPEHTLGMHVFTALFDSGERNARWMAISLEGDDALSALDRIEIPEDIRQSIADKLTPGSSLIISDESKDSAILPNGADFIVLAKSTPALAETPKAKPKHVTIGKPKPSFTRRWNRTGPAYASDYFRSFDQPKRSFFRWRWRR